MMLAEPGETVTVATEAGAVTAGAVEPPQPLSPGKRK
jgi:hypothetical protein